MSSPNPKLDNVSSSDSGPLQELDVVHSNYVPAQMDRHIEFIDFSPTGELVIGASCLNGRYWTGSLWYYKDPSLAPAPEKSLTGVELHTGVMDGRIIGAKGTQILLAMDSGGLEMANLTSEVQDNKRMYYLETQASSLEHDDIITGLDTWPSSSTVLAATVSHDLSLRIWSPQLQLVQSYRHAHSRPLTSVACHEYPHLIATSSLDLTIRVWDTRQPKPAVVVYRSSTTPPSMVTWCQENSLFVGCRTGDAWIQDIRAPRGAPAITPVLDREIRRAKWADNKKNLVAVTGDDNIVKVLDVSGNSIKEKYSDCRHSDFVKGVAWNPITHNLWTAGWDQQIIQHTLPE